ncbi:MAG: hypothetical protein ABSC93_04725 [Bryobacteraceae bacterium]
MRDVKQDGFIAGPDLENPFQKPLRVRVAGGGLNPAIIRSEGARSLEGLVSGVEFLLPGLQKAQIDPPCRLCRREFSGMRKPVTGIHIFTGLKCS